MSTTAGPTDAPTDLERVARELYEVAPAQFVAARNARAAGLRQDGERRLAGAVTRLPRATVAAWAVSVMARELPADVEALGQLGAELRVAQRLANPAELRSLGRRRRQAVTALTRTTARAAGDRNVELSPAACEQVAATWQAVAIDPDAERAVRSGLLVRALEPGHHDPRAALAVPGAVQLSPPDTDAVAPAGHRPVDDVQASPEPADDGEGAGTARRLRRELRSRERIVASLREELDDADDELGRAEAQVLEEAARADELRRELAEAEEDLEQADRARAAVLEERLDVAERVSVAEEELGEVRAQLADVDREQLPGARPPRRERLGES